MGIDVQRVVLAYYETVDTRSPEEVVELFTPDAVYRRPGYAALEGSTQLLEFYADRRVISEGHHTVEALLLSCDRAAVQGSFSGTLRDGRRVVLRFADFFRVGATGRIIERDTYFDAPLV